MDLMKKDKNKLYVQKFVAGAANEEAAASQLGVTINFVEKYLLLIDSLRNCPDAMALLRADHNQYGEKSNFRMNTLVEGRFRSLTPEVKLQVLRFFLESPTRLSRGIY